MMSGSQLRQPRLRLTVNGMVIGGCTSVEVSVQRGSRAATFRLDLASDALQSGFGAQWVDLDAFEVSIEVALSGDDADSSGWTLLMAGAVDRLSIDPVSRSVVLDGRDHAARLIDMPLRQAYLNQTASEVAVDLSARCGLMADVDQTTGLVGQYYQIQHSKTAFGAYSRHGNGWDLLAELAELLDYELWVDGQGLHFKQQQPTSQPLQLNVQAGGIGQAVTVMNATDVLLERSIGLSGAVQVRVDSWNSRQKQAVTALYPSAVASSDAVRLFTVIKPNLLPQQADQLAQTTYRQLRARQRTISATMPGELVLTPRNGLQISGTGSGFDAVYVVQRIVRSLSITHGFTQHVQAVSADSGDGSDD